MEPRIYYECGICGACHPWEFHGDCRENESRFFPQDLDDLYGVDGWEQWEWQERLEADGWSVAS